ncbi:MAG: PQQ-binding-like beta-propeller repeat protein, partial [Actinobacteria bacterium]|nr:PQQ-binding-like beta-propeller repeat protein [Actinomycetota bacterium]
MGGDGAMYVMVIPTTNTGAVVPGDLYAVNPDHTIRWVWHSDANVGSSVPAVAPDGTVYFTADGSGALVAIGAGGVAKWKFTPSGSALTGPVTIGPDGTLYVEDIASRVYAVAPQTGAPTWSFDAKGGFSQPQGAVAMSNDGST